MRGDRGAGRKNTNSSHGFTVRRLVSGVTVWCVVFLVLGCAARNSSKKTTELVEKECGFESGQEYTFNGHWTTSPIKVSFKSGDWTSSEMSAIVAGAESWNSFFTKSKGISLFNLSAANVSGTNQTAPNCAVGTLSEGTIIYKRASGWTKSASAIAVTTTCINTTTTTTGGPASIFNAIMEVNYQNFFPGTSSRTPDLQSIALHELGHLLGLDHSCGPQGKPNQSKPYLTCPDVTGGGDIVEAVMYPEVFFDGSSGIEKRELQTNDQRRANCLY